MVWNVDFYTIFEINLKVIMLFDYDPNIQAKNNKIVLYGVLFTRLFIHLKIYFINEEVSSMKRS